MLLLVPNNLREAAAALGCSQWQVIMMICYRAAKSGILTGVLLAVAEFQEKLHRYYLPLCLINFYLGI